MSEEIVDTVGIFESNIGLVDVFFAISIMNGLKVVVDEFDYSNIDGKIDEYEKLAVAFIGSIENCPPDGIQALADKLKAKNPLVKLVNLSGEKIKDSTIDVSRTNLDVSELNRYLTTRQLE